MRNRAFVVLLVLCIVCGFARATDKPMEYLLATINAGGYVTEDDITVKRFRSLLTQLDRKYVESRNQIGDMSVKTLEVMRDEGIRQNLLELMEGMNRIPVDGLPNQKYSEYLAAYAVLRTQGQSHVEAIEGLAALVDALR